MGLFEMIRKNSGGGGLLTLVKPDLKPVFISEGCDEVEFLNIEVHIGSMSLRVLNCYAPQECDPPQRKSAFWGRLKSEINDANEANCEIIIQFDANSHVGSDLVKGDPNTQNANGIMFSEFLIQNSSLAMVNGTEKCENTITCRRMKNKRKEEAVLDFVIVSHTLEPFLKSMIIDEARQYPLCSYLSKNSTNSDHFTEIIDFQIKFDKKPNERTEHFNFKNQEGLEKTVDLDTQVDRWYQELERIFKRCFRKIRISDNVKETETSKLSTTRTRIVPKLQENKEDEKLKEDLEEIEEQIAQSIAEENFQKISENFATLDQSEGGSCSQGIWDIKSKVFPKVGATIPAAKINPANDRLVTDQEGLKKLYLETFTHRLRTRPPKESVSDTLKLQEGLLKKRLAITADNKSPPWTEGKVKSVLKSLKNGKSRDPLGLINEIFKVDGQDLIKSLTVILNRIKAECKVPQVFIKKILQPFIKEKAQNSS